MEDWDEFGLNPLPPMSARTRIETPPPPIQAIVAQRAAHLAEPLSGVTTDGSVTPDLFTLTPTGVDVAPLTNAALAFLAALTPSQRERATFEMTSQEWRTWINVHMNHFRHGVMLEDLSTDRRQRGLDLLKATLSDTGYAMARDLMTINQFIVDIGADPDSFGAWPYFVSIFGQPGGNDPWGWQLDGHHLNINCVVIGDQVVLTPCFMGSEPRRIRSGPLAGLSVFDDEEQGGIDLIRSFDAAQREQAILLPSIMPDDLPRHLKDPFDGRMQAGAFHDNLVAPYEGVAAGDMTDAQRNLLQRLIASYLSRAPEPFAELHLQAVLDHLDDTWFHWMGGTGDNDPFYYRVHGPVVMIEFDHHPGVVFDNRHPTRNHIHTLIRTPNGGDYGHSLLAQHHERFDHSHGDHARRA